MRPGGDNERQLLHWHHDMLIWIPRVWFLPSLAGLGHPQAFLWHPQHNIRSGFELWSWACRIETRAGDLGAGGVLGSQYREFSEQLLFLLPENFDFVAQARIIAIRT